MYAPIVDSTGVSQQGVDKKGGWVSKKVLACSDDYPDCPQNIFIISEYNISYRTNTTTTFTSEKKTMFLIEKSPF